MSKQTEKTLNRMARKSAQSGQESLSATSLREQYEIIKNDVLKLRKDLEKGYDLARSRLNRKTIFEAVLSKQ